MAYDVGYCCDSFWSKWHDAPPTDARAKAAVLTAKELQPGYDYKIRIRARAVDTGAVGPWQELPTKVHSGQPSAEPGVVAGSPPRLAAAVGAA